MANTESTEQGVRRGSLIREVNERIREVSAALDRFEVLCECGSVECAETVELSAVEYDAVRRDDSCFVVAPGHELPGFEAVVAKTRLYRVLGLPD
jgi:hypothetical protein